MYTLLPRTSLQPALLNLKPSHARNGEIQEFSYKGIKLIYDDALYAQNVATEEKKYFPTDEKTLREQASQFLSENVSFDNIFSFFTENLQAKQNFIDAAENEKLTTFRQALVVGWEKNSDRMVNATNHRRPQLKFDGWKRMWNHVKQEMRQLGVDFNGDFPPKGTEYYECARRFVAEQGFPFIEKLKEPYGSHGKIR